MKYLFYIILLLLLSGCVKLSEKKLEGKWQQMLMYKTDDEIIWEFKKDNTLIRSLNNTMQDLCTYKIQNKLLNSFIVIENSSSLSGFGDINGKHQILRFTRDELILQRVDVPGDACPFLRTELLKK